MAEFVAEVLRAGGREPAGRPAAARAPMLDLKQHPPRSRRRARGARAPRATAPTRGSTACSSSTSAARAAARGRGAAGASRTRRRRRSARAKQAGGDAADGDRRDAGGRPAREGARRRSWPTPTPSCRPRSPRFRTRRTRRRPTRTPSLREVGEAGEAGPRPPRAGRPHDRHGGGRARRRLALRLPQAATSCCSSSRSCAGRWSCCGPRLRAGHPAGARARGGALRHRLPARHRAADLPPGRRRPVPRRHQRGPARVAARRRDPRRGRAAAALRGLLARASAARRARPGGHARHLPRAPVRQGRDVRFVEPEASAEEHERLLAIEEELLQALEIPYRVVEHRASTTSAPRRPRSTTSRRGCPARSRYRELTSCSNTTDFQARRLDIRFRPGRPATCTRSTAPRSPGGT